MKIGSIILILGVINFLLVLFQISTGLRFIKVPFTIHKRTGILLFITALIHGALAVYVD
ncbi:MAG: hypothetical protein OEW45_10050 [Deltaproteobacteria bacterium]|nr:hypothetical protein [Deltaproteobacteria bacterium]